MRQDTHDVFGSPGLRLLQLCILLSSSGRTYSLTRLAGIFHCSRQTVLRMMDQLHRVRDIEVETWMEGRERCYRIISKPSPVLSSLTSDTFRYVALFRDIFRHLLPKSIQNELQDIIGESVDGKNKVPESFPEPWEKGRIDYAPFKAVLDTIQNAMHDRHLCKVNYHARSSGNHHTYTVAPLRVIVYREALYLRCRIYDDFGNPTTDFRTLSIHRVRNLHICDKTFTETPGDDHEPHFGFPFHEPVRVKIAFWRGAAAYVSERTWSSDQRVRKRDDGGIEVTFTTTSRLEIIAWVLSFGPDAELIAPQDLRKEIAKTLDDTRDLYR